MLAQINNVMFKKIIILFWTAWWLIAFWTDVVGALSHFNLLSAAWAPDLNYPTLISSLTMYSAPNWLIHFFFAGILLWSLLSTLLFCLASVSLLQNRAVWLRRAEVAFIVSLTYWLAFFLADQMVMKFDLEENHMVQGGLQLLTFLALYWLPENQ